VVEAALMAASLATARWTTPIALVVLLVLLVALAVSGRWPGVHSKQASAPAGLLGMAPNDVERIHVRAGSDVFALRREPGRWTIEGVNGAAPDELGTHIDTALKFLGVSKPSREIAADELSPESFAAFGLDPPSEVAVLETRSGVAATVNFGTVNPAGTSHYLRLGGAPTVYLMPRHVTEEWRLVFEMAQRLKGTAGSGTASRSANLLLPVSMARVWAIEIVAGGKLTRFERDPAGAWFKHVGQHTHVTGGQVHVADPAQAAIIDAAFRGFDAAVAETHVVPGQAPRLAQYGLALPAMIVLFYPRDSSTPLARLEFGAPADRLDRYARLAPDGAVVTVAEFEPRRLNELLRAVGAGP
jgi:hypothetical protein